MKAYLNKRDKRNREKHSIEVIKGEEQERVVNRSMNVQTPYPEVRKISEKEEKTRKAEARQMWKKEKKTRRRTTFIKSLA